jgi:hypothetical protein
MQLLISWENIAENQIATTALFSQYGQIRHKKTQWLTLPAVKLRTREIPYCACILHSNCKSHLRINISESEEQGGIFQ